MPFTIDEAAVKKQMNYDLSKPQEKTPEVLPEGWLGTMSRGLPVREIPHYDFPRVVYMHPNEPERVVVHRNERHEIVDEEHIPTEHLTKVICCDAHIKSDGGPASCPDCTKLLESALSEGWVTKPYIPQAPAKADANLYGPRIEGKKQEEGKNEKRK